MKKVYGPALISAAEAKIWLAKRCIHQSDSLERERGVNMLVDAMRLIDEGWDGYVHCGKVQCGKSAMEIRDRDVELVNMVEEIDHILQTAKEEWA